jgi:NitT/TauT family transport system substrate-binding protein
MQRRRPLKVLVIALAALSATVLAACGGDDSSAAGTTGGAAATGAATTAEASGEPVTLRLGYFANVTHATPLVGVSEGLYEEALGENVTLETAIFNAGPAEIEALFAEAIDAGYIGPNPAVNGFVQSNGEALRIVSGATSGGAFLVVKPGITSAADLAGKVLATPSLGNTQDVALRAYLKENGLNADTSGGGDVSIRPQENAATLDAFKAGDIDGAWVPEPWATRLVIEGGGEVLVDEADLWPEGRFTTTVLIVSTSFLEDHPDVVKHLIEGHIATEEFIDANEAEAQTIVNDQIEAITDKRMNDEVLSSAWPHLEFTNDPVASSVLQSATDAADVGLLPEVPDITDLFDLTLLNEVLAAQGASAVSGL